MGSIRIEGDPGREIRRELYDQSRPQVPSPKAVCATFIPEFANRR
jgi:hypothetical protein